MNINFNTTFQKCLPFIYIILFTFVLNNIIFFYLPKNGVDFIKDESSTLSYKQYSFYSSTNDINGNLNNSKQVFQTLSKYNLKAIYYTNINSGWIVIEEAEENSSYILSCGEKIDGYTLSKLFKNYVIFEKDKKEYKLEIKEKDPSNYDFSNNGAKQNVNIKNNGAIVNRDYLNLYIVNVDKLAISEMKDGVKL